MDQHRLVSVNVHGLKNSRKRKALFRALHTYKSDICCIQESYVSNSDVAVWKREWGGELFYVEGTSHSKGQVILLSKKISQCMYTVLYQSDRILAITLNIEQHNIAIVNVYGPSVQKDKINFLSEITEVYDKVLSEVDNVFIVGDFNMVMNNALDIIAGDEHNVDEVKKFNDTIDKLQLNDVWRMFYPDDKQYTWHRDNPFIARRLDYIFASDSVFSNILNCGNLIVPSSDHKGVYCDLQFSAFVKGPSYWKFHNSFLHDKLYTEKMNLLIDDIAEDVELEPQMKWEYCKVKIREYSITYGKSKSMDNHNKLYRIKTQLEEVDKLLCDDPQNTDLQTKVTQLTLQYNLQSLHEAKGAQIRSRVKWIEQGEKNNKYFLGMEKVKAINNTITSLEDNNGRVVTEQTEVRDMQYNYYKTLYSKKVNYSEQQENLTEFLSNLNVPQLSEDNKLSCEGMIDTDETGRALSDMRNGSAPGCDGLTTDFMKFFWGKVKTMVVNSFNSAFREGELSTTQRRGVITLVHKRKQLSRQNLDNWRPISLTNTDYKILAKALAKRMQLVVKSVISENQVGYIKGRSISTILRVIDDVISHLDVTDSPGVIMALDYTKAFDTVSKDFLTDIFEMFGFGQQFIQWVKVLMANTESCVGHCGWLTAFFPLESGIRQGCPFSPLAFVLAVELLSLKIQQSDNIKGILLPTMDRDEVWLKLAQYADDANLFLRDRYDVKAAIDIIVSFSTFSGLHLNTAKTKLLWIGSNKQCRDSVCGFESKEDLQILGVYFSGSHGSNIEENWLDRVKKLQQHIQTWSKRDLSIMGKVQIVKTFLLSQFVYVMQSVGIPP
jgi:exonuclease III